MKKKVIALLAVLLLVSSFGKSEANEWSLPVAPAESTDGCLSQNDAVLIAKQKMASYYQRPISDFDFHQVKARLVKLENGENAWIVMVDHNNETLDVGAEVTISPEGGSILRFLTNEEKELTLVLLEQWQEQKGPLRAWTVEDKALFNWLYGSSQTCASPSHYPVSQEKATEIALSALPEPLESPVFYCSFQVLPGTDGTPDQYAWLITISQSGKEKYAVYVSATSGEVLKVVTVSNFG